MKRSRKRLEVSTFPFLAVLLCAMGSLILLLLVIDRRAKAVARAKAEQAIARVAEEDARRAAARRAEWERQQQALHALLAQETQDLQRQLQAVSAQAAAAAADTQSRSVRLDGLRLRLGAETAGLVRKQDDLASRRADIVKA